MNAKDISLNDVINFIDKANSSDIEAVLESIEMTAQMAQVSPEDLESENVVTRRIAENKLHRIHKAVETLNHALQMKGI